MKSADISRTLGLMALAAITGSGAMAADTGWYGGISIGQSKATIDDDRITRRLLGSGFTGVSIVDDEKDAGYKLYGGYRINRNFALEGGYFDLGKFGFTATTVPAGTLTGSIKLRGINLDAVGILPITDKFSVLGRIGVNYAQARDNFSGTGAVSVLDPNPRKNDTNYKYGLGIQYALTESFGLRAEAERYRIDDAVGNKGDVDLFSLGLVYWFGGKAAPAPRAVAPAYVAATPAPERVVVAPPPPPPAAVIVPPAARKVTFSADALFGFDKSTVTPEGKQHLDKFAADLQGTEFDVITVTGHTDRIGSHDYNMALSRRRAEAVKNYLVESAGIPAGKIAARGTDGSDPVTKPGDCVGTKATRELIACLQPDRRVEVEVAGTK